MADETMTQIQWRQPGTPKNAPLFLIHDGGGTIFSYMFLEDLDRDVYGIADPLFDTEQSWEGGIHEMAERYTSQIKSIVSEGSILVGGWSLGGMIALEAAHILRRDAKLTVQGIIMIDTPFPQRWQGTQAGRPLLPSTVSEEIRRKVQRRFEEAHRVIGIWDVPKLWDGKHDVETPGQQATTESHNRNPPPTLLIRATQRVQIGDGTALAYIDVHRDSEVLGWDQCPLILINMVKDVEANHYDIFQGDEKIGRVSEIIRAWSKEIGS